MSVAVHGQFTYHGDRATLTCDPGYKSDVLVSRRLPDGTWPSITCRPVSCNEPPLLDNGYHEGRVYTFPNKVTYKCNEGYVLNSNVADVYCGASGEWTPRPLRCDPVQCPELEPPLNGTVTYQTRSFGSVATYACLPGFHGGGSRTCEADGNWSGEAFECTEPACPRPPLDIRYFSDTLMVFDCDGKSVTAKCLPNGTWSVSKCPEKLPEEQPLPPEEPLVPPEEQPLPPEEPLVPPEEQPLPPEKPAPPPIPPKPLNPLPRAKSLNIFWVMVIFFMIIILCLPIIS